MSDNSRQIMQKKVNQNPTKMYQSFLERNFYALKKTNNDESNQDVLSRTTRNSPMNRF